MSQNNNQRDEQLLLLNALNNICNNNILVLNNIIETNRQIQNLTNQLINNEYNRNNNRRSNNSNRRRNHNNNYDNYDYSSVEYVNTPHTTPNPNPTTNPLETPVQTPNQNHTLNNTNLYRDYTYYFYENPRERTNITTNTRNNAPSRTQIETADRIIQNFFEPITIYPTQSQIENATRQVMYCDIVRPNNTNCPILLEPFNETDTVTVIRYCNHIFNSNALNTWFRTNCRCPVCRYDIRNFNPNIQPNITDPLIPNRRETPRSNATTNTNTRTTTTNTETTLTNLVSNLLNTTNMDENVSDLISQFHQLDASGNDLHPTVSLRFLYETQQNNQL